MIYKPRVEEVRSYTQRWRTTKIQAQPMSLTKLQIIDLILPPSFG
jgi:hypothetical protein